jgi:hypothetical protein
MGTLDRKAQAGDAGKLSIILSHWSWHPNWERPCWSLIFGRKGANLDRKAVTRDARIYYSLREDKYTVGNLASYLLAYGRPGIPYLNIERAERGPAPSCHF